MSINEWGNVTWKFFHTLAEKADETKFPEYKDKFINLIINICKNLPCPDCSKDATNILSKAYINNIQTKEHFVEFIRQFHNIVNLKLLKSTVDTLTEVHDMYKDVHFYNLLNNFFSIFFKRQYNVKLMSHNIQRQGFKQPLQNLIQEILPYCNV